MNKRQVSLTVVAVVVIGFALAVGINTWVTDPEGTGKTLKGLSGVEDVMPYANAAATAVQNEALVTYGITMDDSIPTLTSAVVVQVETFAGTNQLRVLRFNWKDGQNGEQTITAISLTPFPVGTEIYVYDAWLRTPVGHRRMWLIAIDKAMGKAMVQRGEARLAQSEVIEPPR